MSLFRDAGPERSDSDEPVVGYEDLGRATRTQTLAVGTLACSSCDAPVALAGRSAAPSDPMSCPFCLQTGAVRDFLTLGEPTRPMRVVVRLATRARAVPATAAGRPRG